MPSTAAAATMPRIAFLMSTSSHVIAMLPHAECASDLFNVAAIHFRRFRF
jgi:hypothetical protein